MPVNLLPYFGSVNTDDTEETVSSNSEENSYTAGETPISGETGVENMGLAVFQGDELVGELDGLETICHLIISNKLENAQIRISSPIQNLEYIDLYIELANSTKNSVYLTNSTPYITSTISVDAKIQSMNNGVDLSDEETISKIEKAAQSFLEEQIYDYLYKTAKELSADIDGFGIYALKYFSTQDDWEDYNWLHHYSDAFFNIDVDVNLRSSYLLVDTSEGD